MRYAWTAILIGIVTSGCATFDDPSSATQNASAPQLSEGVAIISPADGAVVRGVVPFTAAVGGPVARVDFLVDGIVIGSDTTFPYSVGWDTRVNPLPPPNHAMDLGYYYVEWKNPATFAARRAETNAYTNTYYASRASYVSDDPNWPALLAQSLATAVAEGRRIHLALDMPNSTWTTMLDVARPFWSSVVRIELADEPAWTPAETSAMIQQADSALAARGLRRPPGGLGVVYVYRQPIPAGASAAGLSWVGVEAYIDAPGTGDSSIDIQILRNRVGAQLAQVPAGKSIVLVPMAYDRNGGWGNINTLRDLQIPMYLLVNNDPRVVAINMFSYTRAGGSFDHPELRTPHRLIAEKIFGGSIAGASDGPRSLGVRALLTDGSEATAAIVVTVANGDQVPRAPWEDDPFDNLVPGPLAGQNGWVPVAASPIVSGGVLVLDAPPGDIAAADKDVPDQTTGRHRVTFKVRVDNPSTASMAKLELRTTPSPAALKLCQMYFGNFMRLNSPLETRTIVSPTVAGRWYQMQLDVDLDTHRVDVYVDGVLVQAQIAIPAGPLVGLSISAWDAPGAVIIDDLRGIAF